MESICPYSVMTVPLTGRDSEPLAFANLPPLACFFMSSCSFVLITCGVFCRFNSSCRFKAASLSASSCFLRASSFCRSSSSSKSRRFFALEERFSANFCVSAPFVSNTLRIPAFFFISVLISACCFSSSSCLFFVSATVSSTFFFCW